MDVVVATEPSLQPSPSAFKAHLDALISCCIRENGPCGKILIYQAKLILSVRHKPVSNQVNEDLIEYLTIINCISETIALQ